MIVLFVRSESCLDNKQKVILDIIYQYSPIQKGKLFEVVNEESTVFTDFTETEYGLYSQQFMDVFESLVDKNLVSENRVKENIIVEITEKGKSKAD